MMNLPFKLREQTSFCTPKGPSFSSSKRTRFTLAGTKVEFLAPKHKPESSSTKAGYPESNYNFKEMIFYSDFDQNFKISDSWQYFKLFYHCWAFYGPWFTGALAELRLSMILITPSKPDDKVSFFHPRAFEQAVGDYLTNEYAKEMVYGHSSWIAPQNWQTVTSIPVVAARLQVAPDEIVKYTSIREYLFFPVSDQVMAVMMSNPVPLVPAASQAESDELIDRSSMLELMNNIINSLKITLSPEAKAQQAKALEGLNDTSLIKDFPPMKWTTPEQDAEWEANKSKWEFAQSFKD